MHTRGKDKKEIDVTKHNVPSMLYYFSESAMSGKNVEAYVEYVLVAIYGEVTAYHPIYVWKASVQSPITTTKSRHTWAGSQTLSNPSNYFQNMPTRN